MTTPLFRQEAIDAQRTKIWGDVTLAVPLSLTLTTIFLVLSVAGVIAGVATGTYARKEHVPGFLATRLGVANILAGRAGTITEVHVKEGEVVRQGAPLLTVNVEQTNDSGDGNDSAMLAALHEQEERIDQQLDLESRRTEAATTRLKSEIEGLVGEIDAMDQERKVQTQRTVMAVDQVSSIRALVARGVVSQFELKKREDNLLTAQQAELSFVRTIAQKKNDLILRRADLVQLPLDSEQKMSQLRDTIGELVMKIQQTNGQRAYLITSPKDGRVSALQAWVGKSVETTIPQMSIVPVGDTLKAELFVPTRAIGFVAPGQTVHLSFASFPYQQFGFVEGTVETVSHTLLRPDQSVGPITFGAPAYRVSVTLKSQAIKAYGNEIPLQADMQLNADIVFDRRSLVAWLLDPLLATWRQRA